MKVVIFILIIIFMIFIGFSWIFWQLSDTKVLAEVQNSIRRVDGYELKIADTVNWEFFPTRVTFKNIQLERAQKILLEAKEASFEIDVAELLSLFPRVVISSGKISDAVITISFDNQGNSNWQTKSWTEPGTSKLKSKLKITGTNTAIEKTDYFGQELQSINLDGAQIKLTLGDHDMLLETTQFSLQNPLSTKFLEVLLNGNIAFAEDHLEPIYLDIPVTITATGIQINDGSIAIGVELLKHQINLNTEHNSPGLLTAKLDLSGPISMQANVTFVNLGTEPTLLGDINLQTQNLQTIPFKLEALDFVKSLAIKGQFSINNNNLITITDFNTTINEQTFNASGQFKSDFNSLSLNLFSKNLNLSAWFPKLTQSSKISSTPYSGRLLATDIMRKLSWQINLRIQNLLWENQEFNNVAFSSRSDGDFIRSTVDLKNKWGGSANLQASVDLRGNEPVWKITQSLDILEISSILNWLKLPVNIQGPVSIRGSIQATGNYIRSFTQSIRGSLRLKGTGGGIYIAGIKSVLADVGRLSSNPGLGSSIPDRQGYINFTGKLDLTSGIDSHRLKLTFDNLQLQIDGKINPWQSNLDYTTNLSVHNDLSEYFVLDFPPDLLGLEWQLICKGSYKDKLPCQPNLEAIQETLFLRESTSEEYIPQLN